MTLEDNGELVSPRIGLLGELEVEMQLVRRGWHPVRLDRAQMAANVDLLAVNKRRRVVIQVKTTDAETRHSHSGALGFGYATGYLKDGRSFFNSKNSPLIADVVIGVSYRPQQSRFVIMPVALAEMLCRCHADYWAAIPTRKDTDRSGSFPIYLSFTAEHRDTAHRAHHERMKRNILAFEDRWEILSEPIETLHKPSDWPLL